MPGDLVLRQCSVSMQWDLEANVVIFSKSLQNPSLPVPDLVLPHVEENARYHVWCAVA